MLKPTNIPSIQRTVSKIISTNAAIAFWPREYRNPNREHTSSSLEWIMRGVRRRGGEGGLFRKEEGRCDRSLSKQMKRDERDRERERGASFRLMHCNEYAKCIRTRYAGSSLDNSRPFATTRVWVNVGQFLILSSWRFTDSLLGSFETIFYTCVINNLNWFDKFRFVSQNG